MKNEIWSNFDFSRQLFKTLNFILYKFVGNFLKINGNSSFSRVLIMDLSLNGRGEGVYFIKFVTRYEYFFFF